MSEHVDIITIYGAYETTDEYGRLGGCRGYYTHHSVAETKAKGIGWYGGNGRVQTESAVKINGRYYILKSCDPIVVDDSFDKKIALKQQALAKLTKEEKEVLGL